MPKRRHSKILKRTCEKRSKTVEKKEDSKQVSERSFKKKEVKLATLTIFKKP
jgi:hypothetical protein